MKTLMTEDEVRSKAEGILGLSDANSDQIKAGVGQITTFNQLGFRGVSDKPDGWYIPEDTGSVAVILETKAEGVSIDSKKCIDEIQKNCVIVMERFDHVVGILYNGTETRAYKNNKAIDVPDELQPVDFYIRKFTEESIDKERIYTLTARINNCLHSEFGIKNLYHRMIFTACALVAKRYGAFLSRGMDYSNFHQSILSTLQKELYHDAHQNQKLRLLSDVYSEIRMNLNVNSEDAKEQDHVRNLIGDFIDWITEISDCINSNLWNGEDVMGIFFNEFNRYKKKSENGQVFTPDHITSFMCRLLEINKDDYVLDACAGSGAFLVKAMSIMIQDAGGVDTEKAKMIKQNQIYGIEYDREIFSLCAANFLIHKDGKTNLEQMDTRSQAAINWMSSKPITKVLMNPPYENKYGCITIVENVLDSVSKGTKCAFILPDKKLEKVSQTAIQRILKHHRLETIIKLDEDTFFGVGVTTSIFIFTAGIPQNGQEIFGCYIEEDGLETVKNQGRHDVRNKWQAKEDYWVDAIRKHRDDKYRTDQWIDPEKHLSYQMPEKPFEIFEEDFRKTALDYLMFQKGIDAKEFQEKLLQKTLYSSEVTEDGDKVLIALKRGDGDEND